MAAEDAASQFDLLVGFNRLIIGYERDYNLSAVWELDANLLGPRPLRREDCLFQLTLPYLCWTPTHCFLCSLKSANAPLAATIPRLRLLSGTLAMALNQQISL
jgi:hypothetical protein